MSDVVDSLFGEKEPTEKPLSQHYAEQFEETATKLGEMLLVLNQRVLVLEDELHKLTEAFAEYVTITQKQLNYLISKDPDFIKEKQEMEKSGK